jgi:hypothetical protein
MKATPHTVERSPSGAGSNWLAMSRTRAFLIHLAVSALVVAAAAAIVLLAWYPQPYFTAVGAWDVARTQLVVFLAAGPLLTLILFKPGKRGLKIDVVLVVLVQLAALGYGLTVLYRDRPHFVVFAVDRFYLLGARDVAPEPLAAARAARRFDEQFMRGPTLVVAKMPTDLAQRNRLLTETLFEGKPDIERRPELWHRFADEDRLVLARQKPLAGLSAARPDAASAIGAVAAALGVAENALGFLPLVIGDRHVSVVVDSLTGVPLEIVDADPWIGN